jgi:predicted nucleic acid-binding protein
MALPQTLRTTPLTMADALAVDRPSQDRLSQLADEMGQHVGRQEGNGIADLAESLNIPLLNDLLDESGEVRLPMGLTVYDAMGTTSIGFGSKF